MLTFSERFGDTYTCVGDHLEKMGELASYILR